MDSCGPVNPLSALLKHQERDTSLQHDLSQQPHAGPSQSRFSSTQHHAPPPAAAHQFFAMDRHVSPIQRDLPPVAVENWSSQFQRYQPQPQPQSGDNWSQAFLASKQTSSPPRHAQPSMMQHRSSPMMYNSMQYPMPEYQGKGKARIVELDDKAWQAEFDKHAPQPTQEDIVNIAHEQDIEESANDADEQLIDSLNNTWRNLRQTLDDASLTDQQMAQWEAQFGSQFADQFSIDDDDHTTNDPAFDLEKLEDLLQHPQPFPYIPEEQNPFVCHEDPFAEGQRLLSSGRPLTEAALAFEAACRQNENRGEAWRALGDTLAADEKETKAIRALERAVACENQGGEGAWMSLAVSYVNEGMDSRAMATLERWLTETYPTIARSHPPKPSLESASDPWSNQSRVVDMFIKAATTGPSARASYDGVSTIDPDVQVGLGILFYANSDYDKAKDCFSAALSVRPDDFLLWNRLGATLANGGQPEEAISAYNRALELRPTFTRAIYNLGVSCLNISCHHQAAEHLLAALTLHQTSQAIIPSESDGSENLWHTLKRALLCLGREDLASRATREMNLEEFRKEGFEF